MASSRRPAPEPGTAQVHEAIGRWLARLPGESRILVATSGGLDSIVLLDALARLVPASRLHVGHVDHALQSESAGWAAFVVARARAHGLESSVRRLAGRPGPGESIEAWARAARYAALAEMARNAGCDVVACAHHADDQVETLLIALGRGAGLDGLAAMAPVRPARADTDGPAVHRPLLALPRAALEAWARERRLAFVEDPSNRDCRFTRNALRHRALPALEAAMPGFRIGALRAIEHVVQAQALLRELAVDELRRLAAADGRLDATGLAGLGEARQALVLRTWLEGQGLPAPSAARLADWRRQLMRAGGPPVRLPHAGVWLCRYRDRVWLESDGAEADPAPVHWRWRGEASLALPGLDGDLRILPGGPLPGDWLRSQPWVVRRARGGDRLRLAAGRPSRTMKNLWQERGVPPWLRPRLPVVEVGGRVVFAAGFGCAVAERAPAGQGVGLRFEPREADDPRRTWL